MPFSKTVHTQIVRKRQLTKSIENKHRGLNVIRKKKNNKRTKRIYEINKRDGAAAAAIAVLIRNVKPALAKLNSAPPNLSIDYILFDSYDTWH